MAAVRIGLLAVVVAASALAQEKSGVSARGAIRRPVFVTPAPATADPKQAEALQAAIRSANEAQRETGAANELRAVPPETPGQDPSAAPVSAVSDAPKSHTPGNDIYRWVDGKGVIHYSTNVPAAYKGIAKKVGARQKP